MRIEAQIKTKTILLPPAPGRHRPKPFDFPKEMAVWTLPWTPWERETKKQIKPPKRQLISPAAKTVAEHHHRAQLPFVAAIWVTKIIYIYIYICIYY